MDARILIGGDFVPQQRAQFLLDKSCFNDIWGEVPSRVTSQYDFCILNLECPVINGNATPLKKTGPNLKCDDKAIEAIKFGGFHAVTLANNHFRDYNDEGICSTLSLLKKANLEYVGGGTSLDEAKKILIKRINGISIAFINICENEWSIASKYHGGSNPIDTINLFYQIAEIRQTVDYIIVISHGGKELYELPTPRMQKLFRYIIDLGADVVVNHHQHCFSGFEEYKGKLIFYGLGNLVFDRGEIAPDGWNTGFLVGLSLGQSIKFKLYPYSQFGQQVGLHLMPETSSFDAQIKKLNGIINDENKLHERYLNIVNSNVDFVRGVVEPYWGRAIRAVIRKLGGPYLQSEKGYRYLLANLQCETHFDIFLKGLKTILYKTNKHKS